MYYIDTCWQTTLCRTGQPNSAAKTKSTMANVWQINAKLMWKLMHYNKYAGYYHFNGWPWTNFVHAPW